MSKYEQLIEFIINEQEDKARELFHQIVVAKSREIYESLVDEEDLAVIGQEVEQDEMQEGDEEFGAEEGEIELDGDMDGEEEIGGEEEFGAEEGEGDIEDRVMDLETALDDLKAEFDALMADEANEPEHNDGVTDPDFGGEEEFGAEEVMYEDSEEAEEEDADEEELEESKQGRKMTEAEWIREYVEKVNNGFPGNNIETAEVGKGGSATLNKQSVVAGKNDMGGTASNIAKGGTETDPDGKPVPTPNNQYTKGKGQLKGAGQFKNVPGSKGDSFKAKAPAAKKGEEGGTNDKSPLAK